MRLPRQIVALGIVLATAALASAGETPPESPFAGGQSTPPPLLRPEHPLFCAEGRAIEIDQEKALAGGVTPSDDPGWPVTIDRAGSYVLTSDLKLPNPDVIGIEIIASRVSLNMNGFQVSCGDVTPSPDDHCSGSGSGVVAPDDVHSVRVENGRFFAMGEFAIRLPGAFNRVDGVTVIGFNTVQAVELGSRCSLTDTHLGNGLGGGRVGSFCIVRGVAADGTNGHGLFGGNEVTVSDSSFHSNEYIGLELGDSASVANVTVTNSHDVGIKVGANSTVRDSRSNSNGGSGIEIVSGTVTANVTNGNIGCGILVSGDATVVSNTATSNQVAGLCASPGTGYAQNVFNDNNDPCYPDPACPTDPQVIGGIEIGTNICGGDTICP